MKEKTLYKLIIWGSLIKIILKNKIKLKKYYLR